MATKVYKFGLLPPTVNADLVAQQMLKAHRYRNALTEIERGRRQAVRDVPVPEKGAKRDPAAIHEIETLGRSLQKNARGYSGLSSCWGSYQLMEAAADQSRQMIGKLPGGLSPDHDPSFVSIREARLKVAVHLQNDNIITAAEALACTSRWVQIELQPPRISKQTGLPVARNREAILRLRVDSEGREPVWAAWPMIMHREIPRDARITWATVTCERIGPRPTWWLCLTVDETSSTVTEVETRRPTPVALDVGWRKIGTELRVAVWHDGTIPMQVSPIIVRPSDLRDPAYVLPACGELRLDARTLGGITVADDLRSIRDDAFNRARGFLREWIDGNQVPEWLRQRATHMAQWRQPGKLAALILAWRDNRFAGDEDIYQAMERGWRYHDHHLWRWQSDQRESGLRNRKEIYRIFARRLADRHGTILVERFNKSQVATNKSKKEMAETTGVPLEVATKINHQRTLAAISELVGSEAGGGALQLAAGKDRVQFVESMDSTHICPTHGTVEKFEAGKEIAHTYSCGCTWDQDVSAALVLLRRGERSSGGKTPGSARNGDNPADPQGKRPGKWAKAKAAKAVKVAADETPRNATDNIA